SPSWASRPVGLSEQPQNRGPDIVVTLQIEHPITDLSTWQAHSPALRRHGPTLVFGPRQFTSRLMTRTTSTSDSNSTIRPGPRLQALLATKAVSRCFSGLGGTPRPRILMPLATDPSTS